SSPRTGRPARRRARTSAPSAGSGMSSTPRASRSSLASTPGPRPRTRTRQHRPTPTRARFRGIERDNAQVDVKPLPGLEHLPYAEVWLHAPDVTLWREASAAARAIGKDGLEVWTTDSTPEVVPFLEDRGYAIHRRYVISELDLASAPEPEPPRIPLTTFAQRPDLAAELYAIA